ncbi:MAG: 3-hydroxyacyl-CoA dehydrogenase NAD-binding domain-containing protein [Parvularculales bacterium]
MAFENFSLDVDKDGIALVVWDMPNRSMNVLSQSSLTELSTIIDQIATDGSIKGAVITSGKDAFCAGADLSMLESTPRNGEQAPLSQEERTRTLYENNLSFNMQLRKLETSGKPVAAAINGSALGGGLEVTLACHYRVASDNPKTQLGLPEAKVGLLPGGGGTQRLPRMIGAAQALPLIMQGKNLSPAKALEKNIIHKVVSPDVLVDEAKRWIREDGDSTQPWDKKRYRIPGGGPHDMGSRAAFTFGNAQLRKNTFGNYPAQEYIMSCVYEGLQVPIEAGLRIESRYFTKAMLHPVSKNMIRSLFLSMQALNKGARRPSNIAPRSVKKLGILGAGMMGAGIAYVSAKAGMNVILLDRDQDSAEKGKAYSTTLLDKQIEKGRTTENKKQDLLARITPTKSYEDLQGCDLVIEAVFEDRVIKADVTKKAEAQLEGQAVFASNTSTLPITGLAEVSKNKNHFIGIHFFSPVDRMQLVEIILGQETNDAALACAIDYVRAIGKTPIVVNDSRGFYTSRCFGTYVGEGIAMLAEGIAPAMVENAGRMTGMPVAPLALNDEISLELGYKVRQQTRKDLGDKYRESPADALIEAMVVTHGRLGRKNNKGFYDYPADGNKKDEKCLWPGLADLTPAHKGMDEVDVEELKTRFLYIQALEAARCFEEQVVTDVRDADVGAILGWGFAPWTGGPLSLIDMVGVAAFVEKCDRLAQQYGERFSPPALLRDMAAKGDTFYARFNPEAKRAA